MADISFSTYSGFAPLSIKGNDVERSIAMVEIKPVNELGASFACDNKSQIDAFRKFGIFNLPPGINYVGDVLHNTQITPEQWFYNDFDQLYDREKQFHDKIVTTNAGNAPIHQWEVNYDASQEKPLACRDFEVDPALFAKRKYFCVTYDMDKGLGIGYVRFSEGGYPLDRELKLAVGGKPLVDQGKPVDLAEFLETSISDPRHLIGFPEVDLGSGHHMPLGLRTVGAMIQDGRSRELIDRLSRGETIELDMDAERASWGTVKVSDKQILDKLSLFDYTDKEYVFNSEKQELKILYKMKGYRHTFWAMRGDTLIIGVIRNWLPPNDGTIDPVLYSRVLKPSGATIPELLGFLVDELKVDQAVLLGSGKDCQIICKDGEKTKKMIDNDSVRERPKITSGPLSVIL